MAAGTASKIVALQSCFAQLEHATRDLPTTSGTVKSAPHDSTGTCRSPYLSRLKDPCVAPGPSIGSPQHAAAGLDADTSEQFVASAVKQVHDTSLKGRVGTASGKSALSSESNCDSPCENPSRTIAPRKTEGGQVETKILKQVGRKRPFDRSCGRRWQLEHPESYCRPFQRDFARAQHDSFFCLDALAGPTVFSVLTHSEAAFANEVLVLLHMPQSDQLRRIPAPARGIPSASRRRAVASRVRMDFPEWIGRGKVSPCPTSEQRALDLDLIRFEKTQAKTTSKVGVLYGGSGWSEAEMYAASTEPVPSVFYEFLDLLADRIQLSGFKGYDGLLDVQHDTTGAHSYFTKFDAIEIMFQVAPMIPLTVQHSDPSSLRRTLLCADAVLIVFRLDATEPFDPSVFASKHTHIFIVVSPVKGPADGSVAKPGQYFNIAVASHKNTALFGPPMPKGGTLHEEELRDWLLTKILNGEAAALDGARVFSERLHNVRTELLSGIIEQHQKSPDELAIRRANKAKESTSESDEGLLHVGQRTTERSMLTRKLSERSIQLRKQTKSCTADAQGTQCGLTIVLPETTASLRLVFPKTTQLATVKRVIKKNIPKSASKRKRQLTWSNGVPVSTQQLHQTLNELESSLAQHFHVLVFREVRKKSTPTAGLDGAVLTLTVENDDMQCKTSVPRDITVEKLCKKMCQRFPDSTQTSYLLIKATGEHLQPTRQLGSYQRSLEDADFFLWIATKQEEI